ncbi:hypothetical protein GCM10027176_36200 [Actinoallomurus bryophytorum]
MGGQFLSLVEDADLGVFKDDGDDLAAVGVSDGNLVLAIMSEPLPRRSVERGWAGRGLVRTSRRRARPWRRDVRREWGPQTVSIEQFFPRPYYARSICRTASAAP